MSFRLLSCTARRAVASSSRTQLQKRGYAEAVSDKLKLSLVLPHQSLFTSHEVTQVNLSAVTGDMGILANHVPTIEPLKPGLVEVIEGDGQSKKWFVSGGVATVHPNNMLTINAVEAAALEDVSLEAVRANITEARRAASGGGSEADKAEAEIELGVYESLEYALTHASK